MAGLGLESGDVYGGVVTINFADSVWRMALTPDFETLRPVAAVEELLDLTWLTQPAASGAQLARPTPTASLEKGSPA